MAELRCCWCGCKWGLPLQTIPHVSSKTQVVVISFRELLILSCFLVFTDFHVCLCLHALNSDKEVISQSLCHIVCVMFYGRHEDIKPLSDSVSKHKLEHLGFNLSHSKLTASGHLVWCSSVFMVELDDRSDNRSVLWYWLLWLKANCCWNDSETWKEMRIMSCSRMLKVNTGNEVIL